MHFSCRIYKHQGIICQSIDMNYFLFHQFSYLQTAITNIQCYKLSTNQMIVEKSDISHPLARYIHFYPYTIFFLPSLALSTWQPQIFSQLNSHHALSKMQLLTTTELNFFSIRGILFFLFLIRFMMMMLMTTIGKIYDFVWGWMGVFFSFVDSTQNNSSI